MDRFNEELKDAGVFIDADGLRPSAKGVRMKFAGDERSVSNGPFSDPRSLISGFWLWKVDSKDDAIKWASRIPFQGGEVEIREMAEMSDFDD
jgi:hypothetical protein